MKQYTITRIEGQPDWSAIPALNVDHHNWVDPVDIDMTAQICYDDNGLYLHLKCREANIRAEHNVPQSMVCEDSCMEFFFRPDENDLRYFNFEMNPLGFTYIGFAYDRYRSCRLAPRQEEEMMNKTCRYTEDGWEVFYTIPVSFLQVFFPDYQLIPGRKIYANCFKCGDLTEKPHFISWNPSTSPTPEFHRSCDFGEMILG